MFAALTMQRFTTSAIFDCFDVAVLGLAMSYCNNRRICSSNEGLPPLIKRRMYYESEKDMAVYVRGKMNSPFE